MDCFGIWPLRLHLAKWLMGQYSSEEILPAHVTKMNYINFYRPIFYFCHYISHYFSLYLLIQMNPFAIFKFLNFLNYFKIIFYLYSDEKQVLSEWYIEIQQLKN